MVSRFKRYEPEPDPRSENDRAEVDENGQFALERRHERRILSWSPDPDEELGPEPEADPEPPVFVDEVQEQAHLAVERQAQPAPVPRPVEEPVVNHAPVHEPPPVRQAPARDEVFPVRDEVEELPAAPPPARPKPILPSRPPQTAAGEEPKRRGRPRGRPRRQVHFHVDPDEELLLLAAARKHGSQQKGLVAALQSLQDIEVLRDEIERLRAECERQRVLLADAEAIFRR